MAEARLSEDLAPVLRRAADAADWRALAAADAALATQLRTLAARRMPLDAAERSALAALEAAHRHARGVCAAACQDAGRQLAALAQQRDAARGYAALGAGEAA